MEYTLKMPVVLIKRIGESAGEEWLTATLKCQLDHYLERKKDEGESLEILREFLEKDITYNEGRWTMFLDGESVSVRKIKNGPDSR